MNRHSHALNFLLLLGASIGCASNDLTKSEESESFVGVWNYDQPNLASGTNIAALECPAGNGAPGFCCW
jgi:hypothetical protein